MAISSDPGSEPSITTVGDWLAARFPQSSRQTLKRMVQARRVLLDNRPARMLAQPVDPSTVMDVLDKSAPDKPRNGSQKQAGALHPLRLVYEDDDLLVVDKPAGLLTSSGAKDRRVTAIALVKAYLKNNAPQSLAGLVHRLDRDASGILVFSKNPQAYRSLKQQFFKHSIQRLYRAVVTGPVDPSEGAIRSRLVERADGSVMPALPHGPGQLAITHYRVLERLEDGRTLLEVRLETGRKHQIRVHLSRRGCPIVGDPIYGGIKHDKMLLTAVLLELDHPRTGARVRFTVDDMPNG